MIQSNYRFRIVLVTLGLLAASAAAELKPEEVLVVGNAAVPDSVELTRYYAKARGLPKSNVVLVKTSPKDVIGWEDYQSQLRRPIAAWMKRQKIHNRIRAVCLMWGVPVRISDELKALYARQYGRYHVRMALVQELIGRVGRRFPDPRTEGLEPLSKLFASPLPAPKPLGKLSELRTDIDKMLQLKADEIDRLEDAGKRRIARRQLLALHKEFRGLGGLVPALNKGEKAGGLDRDAVRKRLEEAREALAALERKAPGAETIDRRLELIAEIRGVNGASLAAVKERNARRKMPRDAALDSELALLWQGKYPRKRWVPNPLNYRIAPRLRGKKLPPTLMVTRIDGPTRADALRIIKHSLATEKAGLTGSFAIDAGGLPRAKKYDEHLEELMRFAKRKTDLKVIYDDKVPLLPRGSCPGAALYVGWYSLRKYVPSCTWAQGAVGWHIASFEAQHLRDPSTNEWAAKMIQNGVVATLGAVDEPYLGSFPEPEAFFPLLLTGKYSVAECYWRTVPTASWRITFIGDPLYTPFKANPQVKVADLPEGLAPREE